MQSSFAFIWIEAVKPQKWGKFVVLRAGEAYQVAAGNFQWHQHIVRAHAGPGKEALVGAGKFSREGVIETWKSEGYKIETPPELRPALENLFAEHRALIAERWQA